MTSSNPELLTTHGYIKGIQRRSVYGDLYYSFEKIPYAQVPVGDLRFKAPQPLLEPWADTLDCTETNVQPLQKNLLNGNLEGTEDCLYLNVYVKKLLSEKPLPVMVYIYGGAYKSGGASRSTISPDYFMMKDVILVTLNYRLGPLGFLSLQDPAVDIPGNAGLKDQLLALQWIKENCLNFNGNSDNITLFGNSAGSVSTHHMMNTPKAKNLFHKAILMSGTIHNTWSIMPPQNYAYRLAKALGYEGENIDSDVRDFLLQQTAEDLVNCDIITPEEKLKNISFIFAPVVEPYESEHSIIVQDPKKALKHSWSNDIPLMVGGTSFEALLNYRFFKDFPQSLEYLKEHPEYCLPRELREQKTLDEQKDLGKEALKMYMGDSELSWENVLKYLQMFNHTRFWLGFQLTILQRNRDASASTYMYRFDYDSPNFNQHRIKYCGPDVRGAAHADDLSYLFYSRDSWKLQQESEEFKTIKKMVGIWCSFAKTSNPNCEEIKPIIWTRSDAKNPFKGINISNEITKFKESPEAEKLKYWLELYDKESSC